jgi:hypothetical protein
MAPPAAPGGPGRRAVLLGVAGSAALLLTGCGLDLEELRRVRWDDDQPLPPPSPGPDELARRAAVADADLLHRAAIAALRPEHAAVLTAIADAHVAHLEALGATDLRVETPPRATTGRPTEPAEPTTGDGGETSPAVPALADLPEAEIDAAATALTWLGRTSGGMARLLASIAAADAVHARLLASALGQPVPEVPSPLTAASATQGPLRLGEDAANAVTAAVQGEHAAVYAYDVVAARLAEDARAAALAARAEHDAAVEALSAVLDGADREVPAAEPAYQLPRPLSAPAELVALAVSVEERLSALHAGVVAAAGAGVRLLGADLLLRTAARAARWRGSAVPLPGMA